MTKLTIRNLGLLIIVSLALVATHAIPAEAQPDPPAANRPGFSPADCPSDMPAGYTVECGTVTAPEDHSRPGSPPIHLAIAIVHSLSQDPAPDPILIIDGGPGGRTLDVVSFWLEYINPLLETRDVISFDQRGTGYSQPALTCPELDPYVTEFLEGHWLAEPLIACRDRLIDQEIDLSAYSSAQNAADIGMLREEWNLYGVSYGMQVALTVLRDHPQGVRSVVLDAVTPIEATRRIRSITPHTQVVLLTAYIDDARVVGAPRAGAIGYVRKEADPEVLLAAVRAVARGQSMLDLTVAGSVLQDLVSSAKMQDELTEREMEVLRLLAHGRTNREIAEDLVVGAETVKTHVGNILAKLHLAHRTQAVIHALKQGLISLNDTEL